MKATKFDRFMLGACWALQIFCMIGAATYGLFTVAVWFFDPPPQPLGYSLYFAFLTALLVGFAFFFRWARHEARDLIDF